MTRVKRSVPSRKRTKRLLKRNKGYRGGRKNTIKQAKQAYMKAGSNAYKDRRIKKRTYRRTWISRINSAVRPLGMMYSRFIRAMDDQNIIIDRKILADIAYNNPKVFEAIFKAATKNA